MLSVKQGGIKYQGRSQNSVDKGEQKKTVGRTEQSREGLGQQKRAAETSPHERAVKRRRTQSAEGNSTEQSTEQVSQEMRVRQRGDQKTEVRKASAKTC